MTSWQMHLETRVSPELAWDRERERRGLRRALASKRRRARRRFALELCAAIAVTFAVTHVLRQAPLERVEARPALATPAPTIETNAVRGVAPSEEGVAPRKSEPVGGFAGTGGHGGASVGGHGGNAGTG